MTGSVQIDRHLFRPEAISQEVHDFNAALRRQLEDMPPLTERSEDTPGPFPRPPKSPRAETRSIPAGDGRSIELRVVAPEPPHGAYLHLHGGGLVMGSADQDDTLLGRIADATGLAVVSVEYRLAPQHPHPAAWDDAEAAAIWLARNVEAEFGGPALAIGGESAGATLAVPTLVRLRDRHGFTGFHAANLSYGNYDTTMSPSQHWIGRDGLLVTTDMIRGCSDAYAPDVASRRNPDISAVYANLEKLPPALFTVGTLDAFLDDSLFVFMRWLAAGNDAELAVYPGAPHGFNLMGHPHAAAANTRIDAFLKAHTAPR